MSHETVQIYIQCNQLPCTDFLSETDPQCLVYLEEKIGKQTTSKLLGKTERIMNNPNPRFTKPILVDFLFEQEQTLHVVVVEHDGVDSAEGQSICELRTSLGSVIQGMQDPTHPKTFPLVIRNGLQTTRKPTITLPCYSTTVGREFGMSIDMSLETASHKRSWWLTGKMHDMMFPRKVTIKVLDDNGRPLAMSPSIGWSSLYAMNWSGTERLALTYRAKDEAALLDLYVDVVTQYDCKKDAGQREVTICRFHTTTEKLRNAIAPGVTLQSGDFLLHMTIHRFQPVYTFMDFLSRGLRLHMGMAIDYTESNGDAIDHRSLHYLKAPNGNEYFNAIQSVGRVAEQYSDGAPFHVIGFGANVKTVGTAKDSSPFSLPLLTSTPAQGKLIAFPPALQGVDQVLRAYSQITPTLVFSGPTNFAPVIAHFMAYADTHLTFSQDRQEYLVVLILTDGQICDMPTTTDILFQAAKRPMSIVIGGVGDYDFASMKVLDGDSEEEGGTGRLCNTQGQPCERDIVQFIPLRSVQGDMRRLAMEMIKELPRQIREYAEWKHVTPGRVVTRPLLEEKHMEDVAAPATNMYPHVKEQPHQQYEPLLPAYPPPMYSAPEMDMDAPMDGAAKK